MKKSLLLLALPLAMVACGGGPEGDAEKMCTMMKDYKAAKDAGKDDEAKKIEEEGEKFEDVLKEKYKDKKEDQEKFEAKMKECKDAMR